MYMESWIICYADKVCSGIETAKGIRIPEVVQYFLAKI